MRVVVQDDMQVLHVNYEEMFAPVTHLESFHAVLHIAASWGWKIEQLDIVTTFLHGILKEEIWIEQPHGFEEPGQEDWVWKLQRGLYGLKQAGRIWNKQLDEAMQLFGSHRFPLSTLLTTIMDPLANHSLQSMWAIFLQWPAMTTRWI